MEVKKDSLSCKISSWVSASCQFWFGCYLASSVLCSEGSNFKIWISSVDKRINMYNENPFMINVCHSMKKLLL